MKTHRWWKVKRWCKSYDKFCTISMLTAGSTVILTIGYYYV